MLRRLTMDSINSRRLKIDPIKLRRLTILSDKFQNLDVFRSYAIIFVKRLKLECMIDLEHGGTTLISNFLVF